MKKCFAILWLYATYTVMLIYFPIGSSIYCWIYWLTGCIGISRNLKYEDLKTSVNSNALYQIILAVNVVATLWQLRLKCNHMRTIEIWRTAKEAQNVIPHFSTFHDEMRIRVATFSIHAGYVSNFNLLQHCIVIWYLNGKS